MFWAEMADTVDSMAEGIDEYQSDELLHDAYGCRIDKPSSVGYDCDGKERNLFCCYIYFFLSTSFVADLVFSRNLAQHTARVSCCNDSRRDVVCNHTSCSNDRAVTDAYSRHNADIAANPHLLSYGDRLGDESSFRTLLWVCCMIAGEQSYVWTYQCVVANVYLSAIENNTTEIDVNIIADGDVLAKLTAEIRLYPNILTDGLEESLHNIPAFLHIVVFRAVISTKQFLCFNPAVEQVLVKIIVDFVFLHLVPFCHSHKYLP